MNSRSSETISSGATAPAEAHRLPLHRYPGGLSGFADSHGPARRVNGRRQPGHRPPPPDLNTLNDPTYAMIDFCSNFRVRTYLDLQRLRRRLTDGGGG
jgi:hypothetical protein